MTEEEMRHFVDTTAAAALANKAILACMLANAPVTEDNCILAAAPWFNPNSIHAEAMAGRFLAHVRSTLEASARVSPSAERH